jgi:hypothetical protein
MKYLLKKMLLLEVLMIGLKVLQVLNTHIVLNLDQVKLVLMQTLVSNFQSIEYQESVRKHIVVS